jgi:hypothetical protein
VPSNTVSELRAEAFPRTCPKTSISMAWHGRAGQGRAGQGRAGQRTTNATTRTDRVGIAHWVVPVVFSHGMYRVVARELFMIQEV